MLHLLSKERKVFFWNREFRTHFGKKFRKMEEVRAKQSSDAHGDKDSPVDGVTITADGYSEHDIQVRCAAMIFKGNWCADLSTHERGIRKFFFHGHCACDWNNAKLMLCKCVTWCPK